MKNSKQKMITIIGGLTLSCAATAQVQSIDSFIEDSSIDASFRYRVESADVEGGASAALANTLKSRISIKTGAIAGFSFLVEADNTLQITDDFYDKENGQAASDYDLVLDQETSQLNQAYIQYTGFNSVMKLGNQRITLDNQRHVGGVAFRQDEATFDALSINNTAINNTTIFVAVANNRNSITNSNTEESIALLNVKYKVNKDLAATTYYYSIADTNGTAGLDFDTFGIRATGTAAGFGFEAELATQNKTTAAGTDNDSLYYHLAGSKKIAGIKASLGYEAFGSDNGQAAFATPLGTNHKFFGWSDVMLKGNAFTANDGLQDIYTSAVTKLAGIKLVAQLHKFSSSEGSSDLGTELGLMAAKKFAAYGTSIKLAQYNAGDSGVDVTKIWLTGTAKF